MTPRRGTSPEVFIDTGFVLAIFNDNDKHHAAAVRLAARYAGRPRVTTNAVLLECGDGFADRNRWPVFVAFLAELRAQPTIHVVDIDRALIDRAVTLRSTREPHVGTRRTSRARPWGLTDCVSFVVMRERGMTEALSADKHFREAGFQALLLDVGA